MWNDIADNRGGLALHAGCEVMPHNGHLRRSSSWACRTRARRRRPSPPAGQQASSGRLYRAHAARPGAPPRMAASPRHPGSTPTFEPAICNAAVKPDAYLENVSVDANGKVDFFDTSYTKNGRTAWPLSYVDPWPGNDVPPVEFMPSLSKNENIVPAVARLDREQAASTLTRSPGWMTPSPGRSAEIARTAPAALGTRRGGAAPGSAMLTIRYE